MAELLATASILGVAQNLVASWKADGTLLGTITLPANIYKKGTIAASLTDNRIYTVTGTTTSNNNLLVYNNTGGLVATTPINKHCYDLYVPSAGKVWLAVEGTNNGEIWEYNSSGVFQSVLYNLTFTGGGYGTAGHGMYKFGNFLYFLAVRGTGFTDNSGVFKYDTVGGGVSTLVLSLPQEDITGSSVVPRRFAQAPNGDFFILEKSSGVYRKIDRYSSTGTFEHSITVALNKIAIGLAVDYDGSYVWVTSDNPTIAGDENTVIKRYNIASGTGTEFSAVVNGIPVNQALATPFNGLPAGSVPLSISCPPVTTGKVGEAFNSSMQTVGGISPYTFAVTAGALPPGLTLNTTTGNISGTPTTAGTYTFTISVSDSS